MGLPLDKLLKIRQTRGFYGRAKCLHKHLAVPSERIADGLWHSVDVAGGCKYNVCFQKRGV